MMQIVRICGPAGWGLLVSSAVLWAIALHVMFVILRRGRSSSIRTRYEINALLFWGFIGAAIGFLGQTSAIHAAMKVIIPAKAISPEAIDRGFQESFIPSTWGFAILATSAVLHAIFRLVLAFGGKASGTGATPRQGTSRAQAQGPGSGLGLLMALLIAVSCALPAHAYPLTAASRAGHKPDPPAAAQTKAGEDKEAATPSSTLPADLAALAWIGKAGPDDVVFRVWTSPDGSLAGEAHTLRGGKHLTQSPASRVSWNDPHIEIELITGVVYKADLDAKAKKLSGGLYYKGSLSMEMALDGVKPGSIPGFLSRAGADGEGFSYAYAVPQDTGDGLSPAGPEEVGLDRAALESLVNSVIAGKAGLLHSLLILKNRRLVLEEYFHGYTRDDLHSIRSVTKSVSSLLVGIAVDRGEIKSVDDPLGRFFPKYSGLFKGVWKDVTLENILTMSTGARWTDEEANRTHGAGDAFFKKILSRDLAFRPGERWQYVSANVDLLGGVIKQATGKHADRYAAEYLFGPLGIDKWNWDYGAVDGYRLMDGSLMLTPREMAKIGSMVAARGTWNGKRIVSGDWIDRSTSPHIDTAGGPEKYGYLWWIFYIPTSGGTEEAIVANGKGSQFIVWFPARDLVVVTTGSNDDNRMQFAIGRLLSQYILVPVSD